MKNLALLASTMFTLSINLSLSQLSSFHFYLSYFLPHTNVRGMSEQLCYT